MHLPAPPRSYDGQYGHYERYDRYAYGSVNDRLHTGDGCTWQLKLEAGNFFC